MSNLKVGDTVKLKSGSPLMTIIGDLGDDRFECMWFRRKTKGGGYEEEPLREVFVAKALEQSDEDPIGVMIA